MSGGETAYLSLVIGAFVFFAIALAWISEYERHHRR